MQSSSDEKLDGLDEMLHVLMHVVSPDMPEAPTH